MTDKKQPEKKSAAASQQGSAIVYDKNSKDNNSKDNNSKDNNRIATATKKKMNQETTPQQATPVQSFSNKSLSALALVIGIIALLAVGFLWYQNKETMLQKQDVQEQFSVLQQQFGQQDIAVAQIQQQAARIADYEDQMTEYQQQSAEYQRQTAELVKQIDELRQELKPNKDTLLLARVHDLIYQAQSVIAVSRQNTVYVYDLLTEAQTLLSSVVDPYWDSLRQTLVVDIDAIKAVKLIDSITMYEKIEQIRRNIRKLDFQPLGEESTDIAAEINSDSSEPEQLSIEDTASLLESFADKVATQLKSMVVIRKNEDGVLIQLGIDSFNHVKLLIESGLSQAQLALLQQDKVTFEQSLHQVQLIINNRLGQYQLGQELSKVSEALQTRLFDIPKTLKSYPALKRLESGLE